jgi:thiol-disulfide isomerase/thioredoxin
MKKLVWAVVAGIILGGGYYVAAPGATSDTAPEGEAASSESKKLWTFEMPDLKAASQSIQGLAGTNHSNYILVNFWASWCIPCRREMPMLQSFADDRADDGFLVVGVAIDDEEEARPVVDALRIAYPILLADFEGAELMGDAGNKQGLLPYTVLLDSEGQLLESKLGEIHKEELDAWSAR